MRLRTICFALAAASVAGSCLAQAKHDFSGDQYLSPGCVDGANEMCAASHAEMKAQWPKALKGDYQSQRNVAFCLADGCDGAVRTDFVMSCAWRIVILASGSNQRVSTDNANLRNACGRSMPDDDVTKSKAIAELLFAQIYRRALPPPPWEWIVPVSQLRIDREATPGQLRAAMRTAAQCPSAVVDQRRVNEILGRLGLRPSQIPGSAFDAKFVASKMEQDYPGVAAERSPERTAANCKVLVDLYGPAGVVIPGIASVPMAARYP